MNKCKIYRDHLNFNGKKYPRVKEEDFDGSFGFLVPIAEILTERNRESLYSDMVLAAAYYERGFYEKSLQLFRELLAKESDLEVYLFYYIRLCEGVITKGVDSKTAFYLNISLKLQLWPEWTQKVANTLLAYLFGERMIRCKWCAGVTPFVHPNEPVMLTLGNNYCVKCRRIYFAPSGMWDSPDGRVRSYQRGSFYSDKDFEKDFISDFDIHRGA